MSTHTCRNPLHCIIPPHVHEHLANHPDPAVRRRAIAAIHGSAEDRTSRAVFSAMPAFGARPAPTAQRDRQVYDMKNGDRFGLPGTLARAEGQGPVGDPAVDEAYDHSGYTYDFYKAIFERNSLDDSGMSLISSVHFRTDYNNAFWDGSQMVYGDGDNSIFIRFTKSLDVVGHELTHGVQSFESNLIYQNEPGALNEHFADVFGTLVRQWHGNLAADQDHWRIGADIMGPDTQARSLRILTGEKAYENDPILGTDPQPKHIRDKYTGTADNGGVHINSGIPNHAFYLTATALGGQAWERAGFIWYLTLQNLNRRSKFQAAADMTYQVAGAEYGNDGEEQQAVKTAWGAVGITVGQAKRRGKKR